MSDISQHTTFPKTKMDIAAKEQFLRQEGIKLPQPQDTLSHLQQNPADISGKVKSDPYVTKLEQAYQHRANTFTD